MDVKNSDDFLEEVWTKMKADPAIQAGIRTLKDLKSSELDRAKTENICVEGEEDYPADRSYLETKIDEIYESMIYES